MRKNLNIVEGCMRYSKLVVLFTVALFALGIFSLIKISKQEFPDFTIRQGVVVALYPGARPEVIEEQVAKPLERYLFTFKEIDREKTYSISKSGVLYVMVELKDDIHEKDRVWSKIKLGLQNFKMELPSGVVALVAKDDFGDTSALLISIESDEKSYRELEGYCDKLQDRVMVMESVSNVRKFGVQKEQVSIYLDKSKLAAYGIDQRILFSKLFSQGFTTSGGEVEVNGTTLPIYFADSYKSEQEIASQIIFSGEDGRTLRLKDIATIKREYSKGKSYIEDSGKKAVLLSLEMSTGDNIVQYGKDIDKILNEFRNELPSSVSIERIADQPKVVEESVRSFIRDLFVSIVIVVAVMLILFPFRSALVAATTIPISIFITIAIMYMVGIPLNTVTLAALIVVLGMIVDNSIIVIDAYLEHIDKGYSRWYAAVLSGTKYFGSIFLATLCICIIFFPLLITMSGTFRDFLLDFPWTITISLMVSLLVAMVVIPMFEYALIKKGLKRGAEKKQGINLLDSVQNGYNKLLDLTFRFPRTTIAVGVGSVVLALVLFAGMNHRLMPSADRDQFAVEIYLPTGASIDKTGAVIDSLYSILSNDEEVRSVTSFVGMASPRFQATYAPNLPSDNYGQLIVNTVSNSATVELLDKYTNRMANYFPEAYVRFKQLDYNICSSPIEARFIGDDIAQLKEQADTLMHFLNGMEELVWVHTNYFEQRAALEVTLDPIGSSMVGLSKGVATTQLAMHYEGVGVGSIWEGDYNLPLVLKSSDDGASHDQISLENQYLNGVVPSSPILLRSVATVAPIWHEGQIVRRTGLRTLTVQADIKRGYSSKGLDKKIATFVEENMADNFPSGVTYNIGGYAESDKGNVIPIAKGVSIAALLIFIFLLFNFKKISISIVALGSISLCLLGGIGGLYLWGVPFGLTSVLGIVSLMGIVVRNAIIMFQHAIDLQQKHNFSARDAAFDAGKRRMMPIFLTSATTAVGVVPMIISNSSLWTPMGIVICFGTVWAMVMVVTVLPVLYWMIYKNAA